MSAALVAAAVKVRISSQYLKELSNESAVATTINDTVLEAAAADSIGEFERVTGKTHDTTNASHLAILCRGTVYFLEFYKARDTAMIKGRQSDFYGALTNFRKLAAQLATSNSNIDFEREAAGTQTDMAKERKVFTRGNTTVGATDTIDP